MSAEEELHFLRNFQRLLDEGAFVSTYKFALLQALADLAVERNIEPDGRLPLPVTALAGKFIEYFWRQVLPYKDGKELAYNTGRQAAVVHRVREARTHYHGNLAEAQADIRAWSALEDEVARIIRTMPLWKLQTVGNQPMEFLYRKQDYRDGQIILLPGVAAALRQFHGLLTHLIRGGWVTQVQRIAANRRILGDTTDLPSFLFGIERQALNRFRGVLREHQQGACFYCGRRVTSEGELDHFIPWARYPLDVGQNFVLAHGQCNNAKRDFLAALPHLERWRERNIDSTELARRLHDRELPSDGARALVVARWAYAQGASSRAQLWVKGREFQEVDAGCEQVLS